MRKCFFYRAIVLYKQHIVQCTLRFYASDLSQSLLSLTMRPKTVSGPKDRKSMCLLQPGCKMIQRTTECRGWPGLKTRSLGRIQSMVLADGVELGLGGVRRLSARWSLTDRAISDTISLLGKKAGQANIWRRNSRNQPEESIDQGLILDLEIGLIHTLSVDAPTVIVVYPFTSRLIDSFTMLIKTFQVYQT